MVKTEHLTKRYGELVALQDLSIEVPKGELLALVGPNGAGKTTALKLLVGQLSPTNGRVWIGGVDVHRNPLEAKRFLAFIPDQPFLYEQLTVAELLGFLGGVYQMDPTVLARQTASLSALFGLDGLLSRRLSELSYGMRSRVVLMSSLLHEPQVLIMDEPFFGLDPQTLRLMKQLLRERANSQGMTVILSTHQLAIVEDLAQRIAILAQGRLIALGSFAELKRQYGGSRLEELFFQLTTY